MAIEELADEVATNLEEVAAATRRINPNSVSFFIGGALVGAAVGFYFGNKFMKEKLRAEAFEASKEEVELIRGVYQQKIVAAEPKPSVEEVIEEKGYDRPLKPPVPLYEPPTVTKLDGHSKHEGWDYPQEIQNRSDDAPYVIHQDEFNEDDLGYSKVTYTYYAEDDVLVDDNNIPLAHGDLIVGQDNLKFGHGSDDENVVFVRNDKLGMAMEICRHPGSYEEEVMGLERHEED